MDKEKIALQEMGRRIDETRLIKPLASLVADLAHLLAHNADSLDLPRGVLERIKHDAEDLANT